LRHLGLAEFGELFKTRDASPGKRPARGCGQLNWEIAFLMITLLGRHGSFSLLESFAPHLWIT
jgi:hypothetical protein